MRTVECILVVAHVLVATRAATDDETCADKSCDEPASTPPRPNIVILLADDLGYGDLCSYGHPSQECNAIDTLAAEGVRFQQFYAADTLCTPVWTGTRRCPPFCVPICTPARAALLTGRMPIRTGMTGGRRVLLDFDTGGLPADELTIAEMLHASGYRTGMTGKWHLGVNQRRRDDGVHLPHHHGFEYVGWNLPMTHLWQCDDAMVLHSNGSDETKCFLYYGERVRQQPYVARHLIDRLDESWTEFMAARDARPFFFYYSFPHVHTTQWPTSKTAQASRRGVFGDSINEMAWAVDRVVQSLRTAAIDKQTLVLFLSDHGPHRELCAGGGETAALRGGKSNSWEGGLRIPAIAWWPGTIQPGVSSAVVSALDILPTLAHIAVAADTDARHMYTSKVRRMDGINVDEYLLGRKLDDDDNALTRRRVGGGSD